MPAATAACEQVESIVVKRVQDARLRRLPFQEKIGAGPTREQFEAEVAEGSVRHVGLLESIAMIAVVRRRGPDRGLRCRHCSS